MRTIPMMMLAAALAAGTAAAEKKNEAQGQARQTQQSGRAFDGSASGRGGSTLDTKDAVVAQPKKPASGRTPSQAAEEYRRSGRANPTPQNFRRKAAEPPAPGKQK